MLNDLDGVDLPVVAAPMAGGPSTPALVLAAAEVGALGFLAAGYRSASEMAEQIRAVRPAARTFGVNLFAPSPEPTRVAPEDFARYRTLLQPLAERLDVSLGVDPVEDDDGFAAKVDVLVADPVPVVSFTFGLPDADQIDRLHRAGTLLVATVTTADEARQAHRAGMDALVAQASCAGGHSGTWTPSRPRVDQSLVDLVRAITSTVEIPVWGAGGVSTPEHTREVLAAGAEAVQVGTALLRTPEAGTSAAYRAALVATAEQPTVLTRAFSGRPAGAVRNAFVERFDAVAPAGYPALHHLTSPVRRAAAAAGDWSWINVWGGPGHGVTTEEPAGHVLRHIAGPAH